MKKRLLILLCISLQAQAIRNPFKGITLPYIKQTIYLWMRPIPHTFRFAKKHPLPSSAIAIGGIFLYQKDWRAAALYTAVLYGALKYNLDRDIRYRSANEYLMHERQNWHCLRMGTGQMDPLDRAIFGAGNDGQGLHEFEETILEMAYLDEAGGNAPIYTAYNEKEPCSHCKRKLILPFGCSCGAQYCVGCAGAIKNNRYKCLKCNDEMDNIVDYYY